MKWINNETNINIKNIYIKTIVLIYCGYLNSQGYALFGQQIGEPRRLSISCSSKVLPGAHYPELQLSYRVCETAFSQVGLFLDQPFPGISLRFFRSDLFISFGFSLKSPWPLQRREKNLQSVDSHSEKCMKGMPLLHLHIWKVQIKRMEVWENQFKEWWIGMTENDN